MTQEVRLHVAKAICHVIVSVITIVFAGPSEDSYCASTGSPGRLQYIMDNDLTKVHNYQGSLVNLPTELLVKILSYLPTPDKFKTRYISRRFKDVIEMPLLWKTFVWSDYEPRHVHSVRRILKAYGKNVRRISFPAHLTPTNVLEMAHCCNNVTHLSLPRKIQLSLDHLEEIIRTMTHLVEVDVFTSSIGYGTFSHYEIIKQFIEVIVIGIKSLILRVDQLDRHGRIDRQLCSPVSALLIIENLLEQGHGLPPILNLFTHEDNIGISIRTLESLLASRSTLRSCEIGLYVRGVPMNLYPSVPLRNFKFGPTATPPLVQLSDYGILGLGDSDNLFYVSYYDHYGKVGISLTPNKYDNLHVEHLHYISNFDSVSNIDFYGVDIRPNHLEQLAVACPNLKRLSLMNAENCLQSLQGLRAIIDTCQNLQGLNLVGIPMISVESYLLLWKSLSSIKKLTHLAIDLCLLIQGKNCDVFDKQKFIHMLKSCSNLKALEIIRSWLCLSCEGIRNIEDLLFSHFPSLVYVRLVHVQCTTALQYTITNCHRLKYLSYRTNRHSEVNITLTSSSSCQLHQLCLESSRQVDLSAPSVGMLSAHGKLEQVVLFVRSIATDAITTLIKNSPNLILLYVVTTEPLCDEKGISLHREHYVDTVSKEFSYHKLVTTGNFIVEDEHSLIRKGDLTSHFNTNFTSLWYNASLLHNNSYLC